MESNDSPESRDREETSDISANAVNAALRLPLSGQVNRPVFYVLLNLGLFVDIFCNVKINDSPPPPPTPVPPQTQDTGQLVVVSSGSRSEAEVRGDIPGWLVAHPCK